MATEGGVTLPGVGKVSKKWVMIIGLGSVASIGYFVYRRKKTAASSSPAGTAATDTTGTTGQIDPLTGDIAGSAQDQIDLASLQSGGYGSGMYGASSGGYYSGSGALGTSGVTPPVPGTGGFTTNGQWAQQAEQDLGGLGIDQLALAAALGNYLTGRPVNSAQQSLVDQAIAEEGYPPVSGPGGYPPAMHTTPTGGGGGGGGGGGAGKPATGAVPGLHVLSTSYEDISFQWNPVSGATSYSFGIPGMGSHTTNQTSATIHGLKAHTTYTVNVSASPSVSGKGHSSVTATTKAR